MNYEQTSSENIEMDKKKFYEFIELDKPVPVKEAIEKLCDFHDASPENVLDAFMNLRGFNYGEIVF